MSTPARPSSFTPPAPAEEPRDLGFGSVVATESRSRLLNQDGTFNVERRGLPWGASLSPYHALLTMPWPRFLGLFSLGYVLLNTLFGTLYMLAGDGALVGPGTGFERAFYFSVHTIATIGYGNVAPSGHLANLLVMIEALIGLLGLALVTGIVFARFSRPMPRIVFSRVGIIAPYRGGQAFEFRIANARNAQLIELEAKVIFSRMETREGRVARRFYTLPLERQKVVFFPLAWTIVHPIDRESPLWGSSPEELRRTEAEFLILLTGIDETFSQQVHTRSSYRGEEVVWNARFTDIFSRSQPGRFTIDIGRLDEVERAGGGERGG